jgi:hypothetical protein
LLFVRDGELLPIHLHDQRAAQQSEALVAQQVPTW